MSYETDFHDWATRQAALIRDGRLAEAELVNIAEEIEGLAKTERRELVKLLAVLLMHLLKWQFQPTGRCTSWRLTIKEQRRELADHLAEIANLKAYLAEALRKSYDARADRGGARDRAGRSDVPGRLPLDLRSNYG